jgi:cell wall-associated NlpC family hydrolase
VINDFLSIIKSKLGCGYVLGSQGQTATKEFIDRLVKSNGISHYVFGKTSAYKWVGKQCFDCSGLIVWTLQQFKILKPTQDYVAHDMFNVLCKPIERNSLLPGDLVFVADKNNHISHVGVYIGNEEVIHARGTAYGVVKTPVLAYFNKFGRLKCFENDIDRLSITQICEKVKEKKIIGDTKYWEKKFKLGEPCDPHYVLQVFRNIVKGA